MTRQPTPAPKQPRPITTDPHTGQYQVVVSFRVGSRMRSPLDRWLGNLRSYVTQWANLNADGLEGLDVAVREIGAGGEQDEDEGTWEQTGSANLDEVEFGDPRPINNIQAKGKRL
jgi:hypothetical protein